MACLKSWATSPTIATPTAFLRQVSAPFRGVSASTQNKRRPPSITKCAQSLTPYSNVRRVSCRPDAQSSIEQPEPCWKKRRWSEVISTSFSGRVLKAQRKSLDPASGRICVRQQLVAQGRVLRLHQDGCTELHGYGRAGAWRIVDDAPIAHPLPIGISGG